MTSHSTVLVLKQSNYQERKNKSKKGKTGAVSTRQLFSINVCPLFPTQHTSTALAPCVNPIDGINNINCKLFIFHNDCDFHHLAIFISYNFNSHS